MSAALNCTTPGGLLRSYFPKLGLRPLQRAACPPCNLSIPVANNTCSGPRSNACCVDSGICCDCLEWIGAEQSRHQCSYSGLSTRTNVWKFVQETGMQKTWSDVARSLPDTSEGARHVYLLYRPLSLLSVSAAAGQLSQGQLSGSIFWWDPIPLIC